MDENMSQENIRCTTGEESIARSKARCTMGEESIAQSEVRCTMGEESIAQSEVRCTMGEESMAQSKALLRREKIKARDAIPPSERDKRSEVIIDRILESESFRKAEIVMIYRAVRGEVRLDLLPVRAPEKKYVYPLCLENHEMRAMLPVSPDGWRPGPFHIPEPDPDLSEEIPPEKIDLVLCPCTAFDAECNRLGMGGGYYDRFLPKCRNAEVYGAAYEVQRAERVPHDLLDRPMDGVFTEKERIVIGSIAGNSR